MRSSLSSPSTSRRSDTTQTRSHSSQSQDGREITYLRPPITCHGTRDHASLMPSMPSTHQRDHQRSHSDFHSRMSTRLEVLEQYQSEELRLESSRPVWLSPSDHSESPLKSSPSRCITKSSRRLSQETMLVSMLRTCPSRISREDMSAQTVRTTQPRIPRCSLPRLLSSTIQVRSRTDTPQSLIAIPPILLASSPRSEPRLTSVMVRSLRMPHNPSSLRTPPWLSL